tara:strand:- start:8160 stop:8483 length:324 start_codon:yes stop_codon:yes gene_type:complete
MYRVVYFKYKRKIASGIGGVKTVHAKGYFCSPNLFNDLIVINSTDNSAGLCLSGDDVCEYISKKDYINKTGDKSITKHDVLSTQNIIILALLFACALVVFSEPLVRI